MELLLLARHFEPDQVPEPFGWNQDCTCPVLLWNGRHGVPFPIFSSTLYLVPFRIIALIFWNGRCYSLSSLFVEKGPHLFYIEYGILGSTFLDFWSHWGDEVVVEVKHMKIPTGQFSVLEISDTSCDFRKENVIQSIINQSWYFLYS